MDQRQLESDIKAQGLAYLRTLPRTYVRVVQIGIIPGRKNASKGIFDTFVTQGSRTVWLEYKRPGESLSDEQAIFLDGILRAGGEAYVVHSLEEVQSYFPPPETQLELLAGGRSI